MCDRSNSLLRMQTVLAVLIAGFLIVPELLSIEATGTAIIEVKPQVDAASLFTRYGLIPLDSIPELNKYLVSGGAGNLQMLSKDSNVVSIEYDVLVEISERAILNESTVALLDPSTVALLGQNDLWNVQQPIKSAILLQPALQKIGFDPADVQSGNPITVAVIDTGVDPLHEMLVGSTLPGQNFIDQRLSTDELLDLDPSTAALLLQAGGRAGSNDAVLAPVNPATATLLDPALIAMMNSTPYFGHGTLVSGLIHAIAPTASILPLKAFDASGWGTSFRIAKAIVYAAAQGARVINMSFGLESSSVLVAQALQYAANRNVVLVASLGNNNSRVDQSYPSSYSNVIGVAATDLNDRKASFSNYGPAADIAAPGQALISPYPANLYAAWSGTSAAAALVSGAAAVLVSREALKADQVTNLIESKSDHLSDPTYQLGQGRIDLKSLLGSVPFGQPGSMEGHLTIMAGDWFSGGYSFKFKDGSHIATNFTVTSRVTLAATCPKGGGPGGTIVVDLGAKTYSVPAADTNWLPTGDANSVLSWMGSTQAPDLCNGNPMDNSQGAVFAATISQNPPSGSSVDFRFKYRDPNAKGKGNVNCLDTSDPRRDKADVCGASWSGTVTYP